MIPATFSPEVIQATREHFAAIHRDVIAEAEAGVYAPLDPKGIIEWQRECLEKTLAGESDHTFTFRQRAHALSTGECIAFLA